MAADVLAYCEQTDFSQDKVVLFIIVVASPCIPVSAQTYCKEKLDAFYRYQSRISPVALLCAAL